MNVSKKKDNNSMLIIVLAIAMAVSAFAVVTVIEKNRADKLIREYIENVSSDELKAIDFIVYGFDVTDDGFVFEPTTNTIVKYIGDETNVVVPVKVNGARVKVIVENAFSNKNIETLAIPDTVKGIDYEAFEDNNIKSVVVYDSKGVASNESVFVWIPNKLDELEAQIWDNVVITSKDIRNIEDSRRRTYDFQRDVSRMIRRFNNVLR